jgi:hypothetical protein
MSAGGNEKVVRYEDLLARHVLPLAVFEQVKEGYKPKALVGTAFVVGRNTVVTCWHCVKAALPEGNLYGLGLRRDVYSKQYEQALPLHDLAQAAGGIDIALARADIDVQPALSLAKHPLGYGGEAVTIGYPLPARTGTGFESGARLLRGYVSRIVQYDDPRWAPARAYELDMPAPGGISGGPVVDLARFEVAGLVVGVRLYEERDAPDEQPREHPFTIAYHLETLRNSSGPATDGKPLDEYLGSLMD